MNRRKDTLIQTEIDLLSAAIRLQREGVEEFHGFQIAKIMEGARGTRSLVGHGTLYKALERLEERGCLRSRWEGAEETHARGPRRRLYEITEEGRVALAHAPTAPSVRTLVVRPLPR